MPKNPGVGASSGEGSEAGDLPPQPASVSRPPDSDHDLKQVNETLQTLRQALELKEQGGLAEAEYQELKKSLLTQSGIKLPTIGASRSITSPEITEQTVRQAAIGMYAGELHQLIVQQIEENFRQAEGRARECMRSLVAKLLELYVLYPQDQPYLYNLIDVVCNKPETLEFGLQQIDAIDEEVRNNISTSDVAKALTGIAYRSAKHAVASLESQKRKEPQTAEKTLWDAVEDDTWGGLTGAATTAAIAAVPGFSLAALGFAAAANAPITWVPVAGLLIGAAVTSGWKYARVRWGEQKMAASAQPSAS